MEKKIKFVVGNETRETIFYTDGSTKTVERHFDVLAKNGTKYKATAIPDFDLEKEVVVFEPNNDFVVLLAVDKKLVDEYTSKGHVVAVSIEEVVTTTESTRHEIL